MIAEVKDWLKGKPVKRRSKDWPRVRKVHLILHPFCRACGGEDGIEVHHKLPFHLHPELECEPTNLITLCEKGPGSLNCHVTFGHSGDWKAYNPNVVEDAVLMRTRILERKYE